MIRILEVSGLVLLVIIDTVKATIIERHGDSEKIGVAVDGDVFGLAADTDASTGNPGEIDREDLGTTEVDQTEGIFGVAWEDCLAEDQDVVEGEGAEGAEVGGFRGAATFGEGSIAEEDVFATSHGDSDGVLGVG